MIYIYIYMYISLSLYMIQKEAVHFHTKDNLKRQPRDQRPLQEGSLQVISLLYSSQTWTWRLRDL